MRCAAPRCPKSCQHQGKEAAAMGHALGTLQPPMLPMLLSSAGMRLVPRGTSWPDLHPRAPRAAPGSTHPFVKWLCCASHCLRPQRATLPGYGEGGIFLPWDTHGNKSTA